jgi:topoisomerase-4 subunit A
MMDDNFLQYASYVICDRAIPNLEDGLKPVQRRILYSLHEKDDGRFTKVANVVGHCMQYHPHGDAAIGDALVALVNRGYLIEGQGNFGNLYTGDPAAAPRYIECRLTELARTHLFHDELTAFVPSYDGRRKEPVTLPARLPLLLLLGAEGIAVGLSTRIFPHNFRELIEAQIAILKRKPFELFPDFPQGGLADVSEYDKGNGRVRVRARIETRDKHKLAITELPYGVTTESLLESIEAAVKKKKLPIRSVDDYTAEKVEIEITLAPDADPDAARKALYAFTQCENAYTGRVVVIKGDRPAELDVHEVLRENTAQLLRLLEQELTLRRKNLQEEWHAKSLVRLFIENRIYKKIESCKTFPAVQKAVRDGLAPFRSQLKRDVTDADIEMLLGVRIRRISLFDIEKNREELDGIARELKLIEKHLAEPVRYAVDYLKALLEAHGKNHPRRTELARFDTIEVRELTSRELALAYDRAGGYLGHGVAGEPLLECSSLDKIILVWKDGRYKTVTPPEKLFVGDSLIYAARADRDRVMTVVYRHEAFTYLKRFAFGGTILNKEYRLAEEPAAVLLFRDEPVPELYVEYKPAKGQRIHRQVFKPEQVPVKGVAARGNQLTAKVVARLAAGRPRWWNDDDTAPPGQVH